MNDLIGAVSSFAVGAVLCFVLSYRSALPRWKFFGGFVALGAVACAGWFLSIARFMLEEVPLTGMGALFVSGVLMGGGVGYFANLLRR